MPICGGWACLYRSVISQNKRPAPCPSDFFESNLAPSPPFPSRSPFPTTKKRPLRITMIQSSRLHHWLPQSQVPIYTGQSSKPLRSRGFVYGGHPTPGGTKVLYSMIQCILKHKTWLL